MGIVIRQSAISTAISYVGIVIGYINLLILFPKYMSPEEVGLARIIQDAAMLLVPFAQIGTNQLILRYFPEHKGKDHYGEFISLLAGLLLITLLVFTILFFVFKSAFVAYFSQQSPEVSGYLYYILGLTYILATYQVLVSLSQSSLNIILPNFLKDILLRLLTLLGIILFATETISFLQFIQLLVGAYLLNLFVLLVYLGKNRVLKIKLKWSHLNGSTIKEMLIFMFFTFLGASGILIIGKVDSLMVTGMLGLKATAIYTTAFYIAVLIELPRRAIAQIGLPVISRAFRENNKVEVNDLYRKSAINNLVLGSLIFIGLWINLDNIYTLIPRTEVYSLGRMVVLIIGLSKLFDMAAGLNGEIIIMSKHYKVNVYLVVGLAVVTIVANYLLIPIYGLNGAALGSLIALSLFNLSKFIFLKIRMNLQPFGSNTIIVLIIGATVLLVGLYLPRLDNVYADILYRSGIVTAIYVLAIYLTKVSQELNLIANSLLNRHK